MHKILIRIGVKLVKFIGILSSETLLFEKNKNESRL